MIETTSLKVNGRIYRVRPLNFHEKEFWSKQILKHILEGMNVEELTPQESIELVNRLWNGKTREK